MLNVDRVNPLNVLDCREVQNPPPYFHYIHIDLKYHIFSPIREWIHQNLKNRFYIGESLQLEDNQFKIKIKIGFEEPKEVSFFLLACPHLKQVNI
jgi:hypothetical protein